MKKLFFKIVEKIFDLMIYIFVRPIKFNQKDYKKIMKQQKYEQEKIIKYWKTQVNIMDNMVLETFDSDQNFYRTIRPYDMFVSTNKEDLIKQITGECTNNLYSHFHLQVKTKINEIIKQVDCVDSFKYLIVYFSYINSWIEWNKNIKIV